MQYSLASETKPIDLLHFHFDNMTLGEAAERIAQRAVDLPFCYVVTPNVDHINRVYLDHPDLLPIYHAARLCLCDSRVLAMMARWIAVDLPVVPGSTLVAKLFERYIGPDDPITIIGGTAEMVELLREKFALRRISHYNPPMGFLNDAVEVEDCVDFVAAHPGRFVFLAVGSPQQEILASRIARSGKAVNVGLCVGASLNLLVGIEQRAPVWMQERALEWLHRLLENPQRMWHRYLVRGPRIFSLFLQHEILGGMRRRRGLEPVSGRHKDVLA
jgi:exopolysaccharide biosynthesis WecB/TagA/CpsF family protein